MNKTLTTITTILVLVGALHLGLLGALGIDLLGTVFGTGMIVKLIYTLVGISAVVHIFTDSKKLVK